VAAWLLLRRDTIIVMTHDVIQATCVRDAAIISLCCAFADNAVMNDTHEDRTLHVVVEDRTGTMVDILMRTEVAELVKNVYKTF